MITRRAAVSASGSVGCCPLGVGLAGQGAVVAQRHHLHVVVAAGLLCAGVGADGVTGGDGLGEHLA